MWTVIYIAQNNNVAKRYQDLLVQEGVLVQLRLVGSAHATANTSVEILVPESEAEEAHEIITGYMGE
ncbi:MAG: glutamate decarboxylase [Peptococcaceae bacterium]|nr:glutamate decarboxylase [Peptococcaceae bacterium]